MEKTEKQLVSVIVPVYCTEQFLCQCVDSILQQTWKNLEVILVDDESPDKCPEICDSYAAMDKRVHVIHQKNGGVSAARNAGLDIARGEFIAFADSDDWMAPDMIETLMDACERNKTDLAFCRIVYVQEGRVYQTEPESPEVLSTEEMLTDILLHRRGGVNVYNKLYRSELFQTIRFPVNVRYEEDSVFYPLIRQANAVSYTGTANYFYRIHQDSFCRQTFSYKQAQWKKEQRKKLEEDLVKHDPQLLPLLKYFAAYADFEMLRSWLLYGGTIKDEEEKELRERFNQSFPYMFAVLKKDSRFRREAIWIRLGLWDSIRTMREKANEIEQSLPIEVRREINFENDHFTQRLFREEEYWKIEKELGKADSLVKQRDQLKKENEILSNQNHELLYSHSYRIGRLITSPVAFVRKVMKKKG